MYAGDGNDSRDDDSDGVPKVLTNVIHAEPTDKTIRGFSLSMETASVTPTLTTDAPTAAMTYGAIADGSIDDGRAPVAVPAVSDDTPTMQVTPMDVGYRYAVLRQLTIVIAQGGYTNNLPHVRHLNGQRPIEVHPSPHDKQRVLVVIRRWRDVAAWVRVAALSDFVVLKSTLQGWPPEVRTGARAVLRQLTEACHQPPAYAADGFVYLTL